MTKDVAQVEWFLNLHPIVRILTYVVPIVFVGGVAWSQLNDRVDDLERTQKNRGQKINAIEKQVNKLVLGQGVLQTQTTEFQKGARRDLERILESLEKMKATSPI